MPVESRDDLVKRLRQQAKNRCEHIGQGSETASVEYLAAEQIASDAKRIAELEAERERLWCTACGTVTRDNICDCNRWPHLADAGYKPNFVNYADAQNEQARDLAGKLETAERALAEERERHQWRTIESAPKDGRDVLCFIEGLGMGQMVLYWSEGYWREKANGMGLKRAPSLWKPLDIPDATAIRSGKSDGKE